MKREEMLGMMLAEFAPQIEAAGDFWRAVRCGLIGSTDQGGLTPLRQLIPVSRGGLLKHPDADADWERLVADLVEQRNIDMDALRRMANEVEPESEVDRG